jgi:hypothetical protein
MWLLRLSQLLSCAIDTVSGAFAAVEVDNVVVVAVFCLYGCCRCVAAVTAVVTGVLLWLKLPWSLWRCCGN